jgi:hypothetical protein
VDVAVGKIELAKDDLDLGAFLTGGALDGFDNATGRDQVDVAVGGFNFVSLVCQILFVEEGGDEVGHGLVCGGVAPCPLIMGYTPAVWQAPQWSVHKSSVQPNSSATASVRLKRVELTPHHVPQGVNHMVMPRLLIRLALLRPALQL